MIDDTSGCVIVYNGELYNYRELRSELEAKGHRFKTRSDTEVILRGFLEWKEALLARCNGMWAFVIWDPRTNSAFIARDRFGVKPLYYTHSDGLLIFSSEPKSIHALRRGSPTPNKMRIVDLMIHSRMHSGDSSFYEEIEACPPGHCGYFETGTGRLRLQRYWSYPSTYSLATSGKDSDAQDEFEYLFEDAVRLRFRSDVPVGLTLSGGLDSSAILVAAKRNSLPLSTAYTSVYSTKEAGELEWARKAIESSSGVDLRPVCAPVTLWTNCIERIVYHMDSPSYSPAVIPLWSVMERSRSDGVPVILEGQGADELLGGYPQYVASASVDALRDCDFMRSLKFLRLLFSMGSSSNAGIWFSRKLLPGAEALPPFLQGRIVNTELLQDWKRHGAAAHLSDHNLENSISVSPGNRDLWNSLKQDHATSILPALLHYGDSVSMAHGIETRLPFMDYRLVDWVFKRKPDILDGFRTKAPIRKYLNKFGLPQIANRKDKLGYPVPIADWWNRDGRARIMDSIQSPNNELWDILSRSHTKALAGACTAGSSRALFQMFKVYTTDIWLKQTLQWRVSRDLSNQV